MLTGASSGVGLAAALAFAQRGSRLVLAARTVAPLEQAAARCRQLGAQALAVPTDMAVEDDVTHLAAAAVERFGRIDVWVNAAAVVVAGRFGDEPVDEVRRLVDTNILGYVLGCRAALARFRSQGDGTVVNVASVLGVVPNPAIATYTMSKFAVRGLSLSLDHRATGDRRIRVCTVLPGPVDTPLWAGAANHSGHRLRAIAPATAPERVAAAIVSCARRPRREVPVGVLMRLTLLAHHVAPMTTELAVARASARLMHGPEPAADSAGELFGGRQPAAAVGGGWRHGARRRRLGAALGRAQAGVGWPRQRV